jgi:hypothetical protein
MQARPVAGDEPGEPVRHAVVVHVLMSQTEVDLWESESGDEISTHVVEVCERELIARLGLEGIAL